MRCIKALAGVTASNVTNGQQQGVGRTLSLGSGYKTIRTPRVATHSAGVGQERRRLSLTNGHGREEGNFRVISPFRDAGFGLF